MGLRRASPDLYCAGVHLEVRGLRLHAIERGRGELSVFLHGWLDHAHSFDLLAPLLPGRTVAVDQRGHGESQWVGPGGFYHFPEYVADLDGVLDALSASRVRLVGHSMGASVGLLYAAARPERVAHLTLLDGAPLTIGGDEIPSRLGEFLEDVKKPRQRRTVASIEEAAGRLRKFNTGLAPEAALLLAGQGVSPDPAQGGALAWKWDPLLRAHSPLPYTEDAIRGLVARVKAPVLAIRGQSGILPDAAELHARFPGLRLNQHTIPGTGHHVHLDAPEECARLIADAWGAAAAPVPRART